LLVSKSMLFEAALFCRCGLPKRSKATPKIMESGLPSNWEVRHSNSRNLPYYFDTVSRASSWEPPAGTDSEKLKVYMAHHHSSNGAAKVETNPAPATDGKIQASHLLVKHRDSRRPSSWKESNITRSKEEARTILEGYEKQIHSGATTLGDLAASESDCSSARKGGDLGWFGHNEMQREFEEAAFALQPGEISGIVETPSGLHLIERFG